MPTMNVMLIPTMVYLVCYR